MTPPLPKVTSSANGVSLHCPWCNARMEGATVSLEALDDAWADDVPGWPARSDDGEAGSDLQTTCPVCARPSMVALATGSSIQGATIRFLKLVPIRTEADLRLIRRSA